MESPYYYDNASKVYPNDDLAILFQRRITGTTLASLPDTMRHQYAGLIKEKVMAMHAMGIVHGDLNAGNILISKKGPTKRDIFIHFIDFDTAISVEDALIRDIHMLKVHAIDLSA